jgi:hypothetical protein
MSSKKSKSFPNRSFETSVDEKPGTFDEPAPQRAPSLMTCPNCATSHYCEYRKGKDAKTAIGYCLWCSVETTIKFALDGSSKLFFSWEL